MTSAQPVLAISDGETTLSLIDPLAVMLYEWVPAIPEAKSGGVWKDSPLFDGRSLAYRKMGTVIDTFELKIRGQGQDSAIYKLQELRRLLDKALEYWINETQNEPVYLIAKAPYETNTRYAIILDYRTPKDANPFTQPFFSCVSLVDEFILTVEHGIWQDQVPGNGTCVALSAEQDFAGVVSLETAEPAAYADDAQVYDSLPWDATSSVIALGMSSTPGQENKIGIRFNDVDVPNGAIITRAWIEVVAYFNSPVGQRVTLAFYGDDADDAAIFSTEADYDGRTRTAAYMYSNIIAPWTAGNTYQFPDYSNWLRNIVQEIVNRAGWASGNHMAFLLNMISVPILDSYRHLAAFGNGIYDPPKLYIEYITAENKTYGREATCNPGEVYVVNKHNRAQLTNIFYYDATGPVWTARLGTTLPYPLGPVPPAVPATGDYIYFGCSTATTDSGPFDNLVFDIETMAVDCDLAWEYYNGATWAALTVTDNTFITGDGALVKTGIHSVHWVPPSGWAATAINGVTAFWVRLVITAGAGPVAAIQANRDVYSCTWPFVELAADQVAGDLPALAQVVIANQSEDPVDNDPALRANRILVSSRTLNRGEDFTPYLNISDEQNPTGVTVALGGHTAFANMNAAPTGRRATYTSDANETTTEVTITLSATLTQEYLGRFRAFLRYQFNTGSAGDVSLRLITTPGGGGLARYSDVYFPQVNTDWQTVDFGIVNIPPRTPSDQYSSTKFEISVYASATGKVVYFYDLILMPVDEWHTDAVDKSGLAALTGAIGTGKRLEIDSVTYPRMPDQAVVRGSASGTIQGYYQNRTAGQAFLQANAAQRLWFFCMHYESGTELSSSPDVSNTIRAYKAQRYFSARGNR